MSHYRWALNEDITLQLLLRDGEAGATGKSPEVAIQRVRSMPAGPDLDGWYWDGIEFVATPTWLSMGEVDAGNQPGLYRYRFAQSGIAEAVEYRCYFRASDPEGFDVETHRVADAVLPVLGSRFVTITVVTAGGVPIPRPMVVVADASNLRVLTATRGALNGVAYVNLDDGDYAVRLSAPGYGFVAPELLTVAGDTTVEYEGVAVAVPVIPPGPDLCAIFGTIRDAAGVPIPGACVRAFAKTPQAVAGIQKASRTVSTSTNNDGWFQLDLQRAAKVRFTIEAAGVDFEKTVPDLPSQELVDW